MARIHRYSLPALLLVLVSSVSSAATDWKHMKFSKPDDVIEFFASINYTLANWQSGDLSVPRVYLTHIPARWRHHYANVVTTAEKKRYFFFMLTPMVLRANETIAHQRALVEKMQNTPRWSEADRAQLAAVASEYELATPAGPDDKAVFTKLLRRVDVVPVSLAVAQAAIESGWGMSRFANEGNALFGQWSWGSDAIKPDRVRSELGNYGIRSFETPFESITAYMHNINTHNAYRHMRNLREQARLQKQPLSGTELAAGLEKYSERGLVYVDEVRSLIRVNQLEKTDDAYLRDGTPVMLEPVGEDV